MSKPNRYPENPYPPGTFLAAAWDSGESRRRFADEIAKTRLGRAFLWFMDAANRFARRLGL